MLDEQIGIARGYADPAKAIQNIAARDRSGNNELEGLATTLKLRAVEGSREVTRSIRAWGKEGIIAITFLAATPKAAEFRAWARRFLIAAEQGKVAAPVVSGIKASDEAKEARILLKESLAIAKLMKLDGNQALLYGIGKVKARVGVDLKAELAAFGVPLQLAAPVQTRFLTPTELGRRLQPNMAAKQVNKMLEAKGYQEQCKTASNKTVWSGTEAGRQFWRVMDETKLHNDGTVQVLRWHEDVIQVLQEMVNAVVEPA